MTLLPELVFVRMDGAAAILDFELTGAPDPGGYALFLLPLRRSAMISAARWVERLRGSGSEILGRPATRRGRIRSGSTRRRFRRRSNGGGIRSECIGGGRFGGDPRREVGSGIDASVASVDVARRRRRMVRAIAIDPSSRRTMRFANTSKSVLRAAPPAVIVIDVVVVVVVVAVAVVVVGIAILYQRPAGGKKSLPTPLASPRRNSPS